MLRHTSDFKDSLGMTFNLHVLARALQRVNPRFREDL